MKCGVNLLIFLVVGVNLSVSIFLPEENGQVKKRKDTTIDWVDEQDLYDYNARDGSLWSDLLEQWTVRSDNVSSSSREGRLLQANHRYIPTSGFYITKRMGEAAAVTELEPHQRPPGGKVISQFRPSQPYGMRQQNVQQPPREVSETDLYLLGAIEKLVFRVDYLEQRLRKTEQLVYYLMQGNNAKDENYCPQNFTQVGKKCYHFGDSREVNWQSANNLCKTLGAHLAEFEEKLEFKQMIKYLLSQSSSQKGKDFWLGGLNPGLLWIWSNSARPIHANTNLTLAAASTPKANNEVPTDNSANVQKVKREANRVTGKQLSNEDNSSSVTYDEIKGNGRCLKLSYNAKKDRYQYTGHDCSTRQHYLCEFEDNQTENEIDRVSKAVTEKEEETED